MNEFPRFTVIIPLKDRGEYIGPTLRTCMAQNYPNFEIIVSDDSSEDDTVRVVNELASVDNRIKLFAHNHHLGMRDNFEFALNQVSDGYVIALGGDDGLIPGAIWRMYELLQETKCELLTWSPASFVYPSNANSKPIFLVKDKKPFTKIIDGSSFLNEISKTFRYQIDTCPMFYIKGVAAVSLVKRVKSRTPDNSFYYCPTPDGFSGVVLAGEAGKYAYTSEPLSIGGTTPKSQGDNYYKTDKKAREDSEQFFKDSVRRTMHKELASQPYSPLVTLMTADYLLTARDLPGWPGRFEMFSFEDLIKESFKLMSSAPFSNEVLGRELEILKNISIQHNCLDLYLTLLKGRRSYPVFKEVVGFAHTRSYRFDAHELKINDVFDAAVATQFVYYFFRKNLILRFLEMIKNTFYIVFNNKKKIKTNYPNIK